MESGQLRWRCRRGMKELDVVLSRWLQHEYPAATSDQRHLFEQLLDLPDPTLAGYLLGNVQPADPAQLALVASLRRCGA